MTEKTRIEKLENPQDLLTLLKLPRTFEWDGSTWEHGSSSAESMAAMLGLHGPERVYAPTIEWMAHDKDAHGNFTRHQRIQMVFEVDGTTISADRVEVMKY